MEGYRIKAISFFSLTKQDSSLSYRSEVKSSESRESNQITDLSGTITAPCKIKTTTQNT